MSESLMWGYLQPLSLHQALEASDGPAGRLQYDLSQGGHLQGGVCSFCTVNKNWRPLSETKHDGTWLWDETKRDGIAYGISLSIYWSRINMTSKLCSLTCRCTGQPGRQWWGSPWHESASWKPLVCSTSGPYCATGRYTPLPALSGSPEGR